MTSVRKPQGRLFSLLCAVLLFLALANRSDAQVVSPPVDVAQVLTPGAVIEFSGIRFSNFQALADSTLPGAVTIGTVQLGGSFGLSFATQPSFLSTNTPSLEPRFAVSFIAEKIGMGEFGHGIITVDGEWTGSGAFQAQYEMSEVDDSGPSIFATAIQSGVEINNKRAAIGSFFVAGVQRVEVRMFSGVKVFSSPGLATVSNIQFLLAAPGPLNPAGDFNFDGRVDGRDFLMWQHQFGSTFDLEADGNRDGTVNAADLVLWQDTYGVQIGPPGDFDADGDVDGRDFLTWQRALGTNNPQVDADQNGVVDSADLSIWSDNYGTSSSLQAVVASVPEPATWLLALGGMGIAWLMVRSRR